jgi:hypothetical protein
MTKGNTPKNLDNLGGADIALIRAHACGSRIFRPADPTTEPYDTSALERAVEAIAAQHDVTVTDLITAVYGRSAKTLIYPVEYSYRRQLFLANGLAEAIAAASQNPADIARRMYEHGLERRLIPVEHDEQAVQEELTAVVAQTWAHPDIAAEIPLLAGSDEYIVMRLREYGDDADLTQIPVAEPDSCVHGITVCAETASENCVGSWSCDWQIIESQSNIDQLLRYVIHEFALPPIG